MSIPRYDVRPVMRQLALLSRAAFATTGSGAAITATVSGGSVTGLSVTAGGSGYGTYARVVVDGGDAPAEAYANVALGSVTSATLLYGGSGYASAPTVRVEAPLNYVYDAIPLVFTETAPFLFFEYTGGSNEYETYCLTRREYHIHALACMCPLQETATADRLTREFPGMFMEFLRVNYTLGNTVREARIVSDSVMPVTLRSSQNGGAKWLANMFDVLVIDGD